MSQLSRRSPNTGLRNLSDDEVINSWFRPGLVGSPFSAAQEAYTSATHLFSTTLTQDECKRIWIRDKPTMQDAVLAVQQAQLEYDSRKRKGKAGEYLSAFSKRVLHYGEIMDTLSQHHPEYVSLAWGAIKFLFIGVLHHEELITSIAKTLTRIADVLPRAELHLTLYPTSDMLNAVSEVYAHIIKFIEYAVRWYKKGKILHGVGAILKPFQLVGKEAAENIAESSRRVDRLASVASKAELRELHLKVIELTSLAMENRALNTRMSIDVLAIARNQISHLTSLQSIGNVHQAQITLQYNRAMRNRYRLRQRGVNLYAHLLPSLTQWASGPAERLLLAHTKIDRKSARCFATDMIDLVQEAQIPVLWVLPGADFKIKDVSLVDMLRSIMIQAMQIDRSSSITAHFQPISSSEVEAAKTHEDWSLLIRRAIEGLAQVFLVVDSDLLKPEDHGAQQGAIKVMTRLMELCSTGPRLRIILIARRFKGNLYDDDLDEGDAHVRVFADVGSRRTTGTQDASQRRKMDNTRGRGLAKSRRAALALRPVFAVDSTQQGPTKTCSDEDSDYD